MGSGLMQMTFNIPAALGVALVTSIIGTITQAKVTEALAGSAFADEAAAYAQLIEDGDDSRAADLVSKLPAEAQQLIDEAIRAAQSSSITMSMVVLGFIALAGAVMAALLIGRRRGLDDAEPPAYSAV